VQTTSTEVLMSILFRAVIPIAKIETVFIVSAYDIASVLYGDLERNHILALVCYDYIGKVCRFPVEARQGLVALVLNDMRRGVRIKHCIDVLPKFVKHNVIDDVVAIDVIAAVAPEVTDEQARYAFTWALALLLKRGAPAAIAFVSEQLEMFMQGMDKALDVDQEMIVMMLFYLAMQKPDMDDLFVKLLLSKFPLKKMPRGTAKVALVVLEISRRENAAVFAVDLFVALVRLFASSPYERNHVFKLGDELTEQLEDYLFALWNVVELQAVLPEFVEAAQSESINQLRVMAALNRAAVRQL
jgi:hypothetical protein